METEKVIYIGKTPYIVTGDEHVMKSAELASIKDLHDTSDMCVEDLGEGWVKVTIGN